MQEMEVLTVRDDLPGSSPVMVLREVEGSHRLLPVFIGEPEAMAINFALNGVVTPRPLTHDLLIETLRELNVSLVSVTITHVLSGTYYAELRLQSADGTERCISARPSDSVALAVRTNTPIFVSDEVLEESGIEADLDGENADSADELEEFREFLDSVNPDDFNA